MKTFLNKKQLAVILDIQVEDARAKMCVAWSRAKGIKNDATRYKKKIVSDFPDTMPVDLLAAELGIPTLQEMVNDIEQNYTKRSATRKYILNDFPEKMIAKIVQTGKAKKIAIPSGLRSLLSKKCIDDIQTYWTEHYPKYFNK